MKYKTKRIEKSIPVSEFVEKYVDVPKFLKFCEECKNYNKVWSCPKYDFDPMDIWNSYESLDLVVIKIIYDEESSKKTFTEDELKTIGRNSLLVEKQNLMDEFMEIEKSSPDTLFLAAGSCDVCGPNDETINCAKILGEPCRYPDKLRYSVESLGGDVVKAAEDIFGIELKWSNEDTLPEYFILMCGLLKK